MIKIETDDGPISLFPQEKMSLGGDGQMPNEVQVIYCDETNSERMPETVTTKQLCIVKAVQQFYTETVDFYYIDGNGITHTQ